MEDIDSIIIFNLKYNTTITNKLDKYIYMYYLIYIKEQIKEENFDKKVFNYILKYNKYYEFDYLYLNRINLLEKILPCFIFNLIVDMYFNSKNINFIFTKDNTSLLIDVFNLKIKNEYFITRMFEKLNSSLYLFESKKLYFNYSNTLELLINSNNFMLIKEIIEKGVYEVNVLYNILGKNINNEIVFNFLNIYILNRVFY